MGRDLLGKRGTRGLSGADDEFDHPRSQVDVCDEWCNPEGDHPSAGEARSTGRRKTRCEPRGIALFDAQRANCGEGEDGADPLSLKSVRNERSASRRLRRTDARRAPSCRSRRKLAYCQSCKIAEWAWLP